MPSRFLHPWVAVRLLQNQHDGWRQDSVSRQPHGPKDASRAREGGSVKGASLRIAAAAGLT